MRLRVYVPVLLALALAAGLIFGARLPGGDTGGPVAQGGSDPGNTAGATTSGDPSGTGSPSGGDPNSESPTTPPSDIPKFEVTKLKKGEKPPQFIVLSFDGSANHELLQHYMALGRETGARFSFFISGVYLVPETNPFVYKPPRHDVGASAIGFGTPDLLPNRIKDLNQAYLAGHEMGTHYNGHFCGPDGVGQWNTDDWLSEIKQFDDFIDNTEKYIGPGESLDFDHTVVVGGRTPCLEGNRPAMYRAMKKSGYRYDASNSGYIKWPEKNSYGLWDFPLPTVKVAGFDRSNLAMDYNFMCAQNNCSRDASPAKAKKIEESTYQTYMNALNATYNGSRAPLFFGNHLNNWIDGAYKNALSQFIVSACGNPDYPDVKCVSNEDMANWLDAQDPAVLKALQEKSPVDM